MPCTSPVGFIAHRPSASHPAWARTDGRLRFLQLRGRMRRLFNLPGWILVGGILPSLTILGAARVQAAAALPDIRAEQAGQIATLDNGLLRVLFDGAGGAFSLTAPAAAGPGGGRAFVSKGSLSRVAEGAAVAGTKVT